MRRLIGTTGVVAVLVASMLGATPGAARAAAGDVCTWNGASGATDVNDPANYIPATGSSCASLDGARLVFPATVPASGAALALTADLSVDSIVLQGSYTLGGTHTLSVSYGPASGYISIDATGGSSTIAAGVTGTDGLMGVAVAADASIDFTGAVSSTGGLQINDTGGGTGSVALSADNPALGGIDVYGGTLTLGSNGAAGTGVVYVFGGSVLALDAGVTVPAARALYLGGTLEATGSGTATWAGDVYFGAASVTLAAATGAVLQVPGTVADNGWNTSVTVGQSGWTGTVVLTGVTGDVVISSNFWGGATTVAYGTLEVGAANAVSTGGAVNVMAGATLDLHGHSQTIVATTGSGTITDSVGGGTLKLTLTPASALTVTETIAGAANVSVYTGSGATATLAPASAAGNTYTGSTVTFGFGALVIRAGSALGATSGVTVGSSSTDGILQLDGTMTLSAPIAIPSGLVEVTGTGHTATLTGAINVGTPSYPGTLAAAAGDALDVSGPVTGAWLHVGTSSLTGTVTLSNSGNTAPTEVVAGTLAVSKALGSVIVDAGATLAGTGTVGSLSIQGSGTLIVGADATHPGTLTAGSVYSAIGSTLGIDIAGETPGSGYSQLVSSGSSGGANLHGNLDVTVDPSYTPTPGTTFDVFTAPYIVGTFANAPDGAILTVGDYSFRVTYVTSAGAQYSEPTDVFLTALGAPAAPTNVVATVQKTGHGKTATQSVSLTWAAPTNDGGTAITGYLVNVYSYAKGKNPGYTLVSSSPLDTQSTALTFTVPDSALSGGTYAFTVAAVNQFGTGTYSDYSNTIRY